MSLDQLRKMREKLQRAAEKGEDKKTAEEAAKPKPGSEPPLVEENNSLTQNLPNQERSVFESGLQVPLAQLPEPFTEEKTEEQVETAQEATPEPQPEPPLPTYQQPVAGEENLVEKVTNMVLSELDSILKPLRERIAELKGMADATGGGMDELEEKMNGVLAEANDLKGKVGTLETSMASIEQQTTVLEARAEQRLNEMNGRLSGAEETVTTLEEKVFNLNSKVGGLEEKRAELEAKVAANDAQFGAVGESFDELNGKIDMAQAATTDLDGRVNALETGLGETNNGLAAAKAELKADIESASGDVSRVDKKLDTGLADLQRDMLAQIEAKAAEQHARAGKVETDLKTAQADVKTVGNRVLDVEERVGGLEARADSAGEKFDEVGDSLDELGGMIARVRSKADGTEAEVRSQEAKLKKQGDALVDIAGDNYERAKSIGKDNIEVTKKALVLVLVDDNYAESLGSEDMRERGPNAVHAKLQEIASDPDYVRELLAKNFYQVEPGQLKAYLRDKRNAKIAKWLSDKTKTVVERARNCAGGDV